ncbi:MAG: class I SAM-dependent methyltransferase [Actinopolymorphaceae bacterium]
MNDTTNVRQRRRKLVPEMEGMTARWYARQRSSGDQLESYRTGADKLAGEFPDGTAVLEVAPGPGFHAIELARTGHFRVTGLDVSHTFVDLANDRARQERVTVDFRHGDVADMPFAAKSFGLVVCQAAFKNFARPIDALDEMHRVLRGGGTAVIQDLRSNASAAEIDQEVARMRLSRVNAFMVRRTLGMLRRRAYAPDQFHRLAEQSAFKECTLTTEGIGMAIRLRKQ